MYDSDSNTVITALQGSSTAIFSDSTIQQILKLATSSGDTNITISTATITDGVANFTAGTEIGFVNVTTANTPVAIGGDTGTIILGGSGSVNATIGDATSAAVSSGAQGSVHQGGTATSGVERVVVTTAQADKITIADAKNTLVTANDGDTIVAGHGYDTVVAAQGDSTVQGGGHTIVQLSGHDSDYTVAVSNGHAVLSNATTHQDIDVTNLQYVQLADGNAVVLAANVNEAALAHLYEALLGRDADFGGLEYYFNLVEKGASLTAIAEGFLNAAEYTGATLSDADFVSALYTNALGRAADADGAAYWQEALEHGATRAEVAAAFADTAAHAATNGEVTVVGSIHVVAGIV